jgi:hypothetical protein
MMHLSLIGMVFTVCSIGALCGPPISGLIEARTGGYVAVGYYAGMYSPLCLWHRVLVVIHG